MWKCEVLLKQDGVKKELGTIPQGAVLLRKGLER